MKHSRTESQLPLYSASPASSSSSSLTSISEGHNKSSTRKDSRTPPLHYDKIPWNAENPRASRLSSSVSSLCSALPAGLAAVQTLLLPGRRRPLPTICFCLIALLILASLTTSDKYIPDSVSASRARLTSIFTGSNAVQLPKAPPTSDITSATQGGGHKWQSPTPPLSPDASLNERLQSLWDAPLSEPANWVKWNSQTCSRDRVKQAQNDWITQDAALIWHSLNTTDIRRYRKGMIDYLVECEKQGLLDPKNAGEGRG